MSQLSYTNLTDGTIPVAADFNSRYLLAINLLNNGIEEDNISADAVITAKIIDAAVTSAKLAAASVTTAKIADGAVTDAKLANLRASAVKGTFANMTIERASASTVDIDADYLVVEDGSGDRVDISSINLTADITASGANGLDTGSENSGTWYYVWVIYNSVSTTTAALLSTSSTSPTMPSGYTYKALVSAVRNDSSSDFLDFKQHGLEYWYAAFQSMATGNIGTGAWTSFSTSSYVPSGISTDVRGTIGSGNKIGITNDNATSTSDSTIEGTRYILNGNALEQEAMWRFLITTSDTLYWYSSAVNSTVYCSGFHVNKLSG